MFKGIQEYIATKGVLAVLPTMGRFIIAAATGYVLGGPASLIQVVLTGVLGTGAYGVWSLQEKANTVPLTPKVIAQRKGIEYATPVAVALDKG